MKPDTRKHHELLTRLCQVFASGSPLPDTPRQITDAIADYLSCERVSLELLPRGPLGSRAFLRDPEEAPTAREVSIQTGAGPGTHRALEGRAVRIASDQTASDLLDAERELLGRGYRVCAWAPLHSRDEVLGLLGLASRRAEAFEPDNPTPLEDLAAVLVLGLETLALRARVQELSRFQQENVYLRDERRTDRDLRLLTGESQAMKAVRLAIQQVARADSTVLIVGETGTGKELVARAIHQLSGRRDHLLVAVNCAALAPGVLASELFGHEAGAFTGATRRRVGRFELADRGTLFLDEIGELTPEMQVMLLRVLQERVIERVGGQGPIPVDVRVLAATHRDLAEAMSAGRFRADLFFRLNVFPIRLPPLRDRREDIPDLVKHFLLHFQRRMNRPVTCVSPAGMRLLLGYDWPGNIRELENLVERAMIVTTGDMLEIDPHWLRPVPTGGAAPPARPGLADVERRTILDALARCRGKIYGPDGAAATLGLKPTTLYGKMRKHGIERNAIPG